MEKEKKTALNMIGKQTNNEGFFAVPAKGEVRVDARLDDWDLSGLIESYADSSIKDIFSVKTAAMWDEDNLYLAFIWRDPYPMCSRFNPMQDKDRGWMSDSVQLRILAGNQPSWITLWCYDGDKSVVDVVYLDSENTQARLVKREGDDASRLFYTGVPGEMELGDGVAMAYRIAEDGKGFIQEVRLPWKVLFDEEYSMKAGEVIRLGMDFHYGPAGGNDRPIHSYCDNVRPGGGMRSFFWTRVENWGDLVLLADSVAEPRIYREEPEAPAGTIALRVKVPADAKTFTVTVNTKDGERIRNVAGGYPVAEYQVGEEDGQAIVEVLWDGLDEAGKLVKPGEYVLAGITANGIDGYYESSFYNPGTPPWKTSDSRGSWGADHTIAHLLARAGDGIVVCSRFAEGGFGTFLLETAGERAYTKRWSEIRGTDALAANDKYVFLIPNDWSASGVELLRMDVTDGHFVPFVREGKELPMPYPLKELFEMEKAPTVTALAACGNVLLARCSDHTIRAIDPENGGCTRVYSLKNDDMDAVETFRLGSSTFDEKKNAYAMATDGTDAYYIAGNRIYKLNLKTGEEAATPLLAAECPAAIAMDADGKIYIADCGPAQQIIKCTPDGEVLLRIGTFGGRPRQGTYERGGLFQPSSVVVDASGLIWVTEGGTTPRRISVWTREGEFRKEFIGNCGYAGQGTLIHTQDPTKAFAEYSEMVLDPGTGKWEVGNVMYNPDPAGGLAFTPGDTPFDHGSMFFSEASGDSHEYFAVLGWPRRSSFFLMMKKGENWIPAAGMATVANLLKLFGGAHGRMLERAPYGEWADQDPADMVFWNDYNNDGYVTKDECVIVPALGSSLQAGGELPFAGHIIQTYIPFDVCSSAAISSEDLSFYLTKKEPGKKPMACLIKPVSFRDGGLPVYLPEGITPITDEYKLVASAALIPGKDLTVAFIEQDGSTYVAGLRKSDGKILWKYISPYHEVHGSHHAPMPKPGLLIGCLKVAGCAKDCGDSDVIMVRGNMGEDYFLTTDGMYIDILTRDGRLPGISFPENAEDLKKVSFAQFSGRGEHFSGLFTKHWDGVVRCHGGLPACEAGNIIRIEGLDSIRHYEPVSVMITDEEIVRADADMQERALANKKEQEPLIIAPMEGEAPNWEKAVRFEIAKKGQSVHGTFRAMYDEGRLYLNYEVSGIRWVNGGNNWRLLFKTGDCVDFQCSPSANRKIDAAAGDYRLLIAPFEGRNAAILMRQVDGRDKGTAFDESYKYTSPVTDIVFDTVRKLDDVTITAENSDGKVRICAAIPWEELGMKAPEAGTTLTGDVGIIVADSAGQINTARIYRSNPGTNLVNDQPGEARIRPDGFGEMKF